MTLPTAATPIVLITGCSSGIGKALALAFHDQGFQVWATARNPDRLADLADRGMVTAALDVTDPAAIAAVVQRLRHEAGRLDYLINNAGYGQMGASLDLDPAAVAAQFHTNVFAPLALCQAVAPLLRDQGGGTIVNMGSISGVLTSPFAGVYCASKAALHALSDALRLELAPFGIRVITVQPGGITSNFGVAARRLVPDNSAQSWYRPLAEAIQQRAMASQVKATPTDAFAAAVVATVTRPNPPAVVRLGQGYWRFFALQRLLPTPLLDRLLSRKFGLDRLL
ncbi:MAG: SDR family oxidoreductase [Prochlorothrix sp.]|nr:SDR family oxidoreductase [Prochlorothrix sp.]